MRMTGLVIGLVMTIVGAIWILQGLNLLPGSFMTGQIKWAVYGGVCWIAGMALLITCRRAGRTPPHP